MQTLQLIDTLDLSDIKKKLCLPFEGGGYAWPPDEAEQAITEYRQFLKEVFAQQQNHEQETLLSPPSQLVDIVWHTHILFTKKYQQDCQAIFGFYLHHYPEV